MVLLAAATTGSNAPFLLIVPYFTVAGDVEASKSVLAYKADGATGNLTLVRGSPFASGSDPTSAAFTPDGRFAYVINKRSVNVSAYEIESAGILKSVQGSPFALDYSADGPSGIVVDPTGRIAYVVSDAGVSAFRIDATSGALTRVAGSPFAVEGQDGFGTASIAVDPSSKHAYVLNYFRNTIVAYAIDASGALERAGTPLEAGQNSNDIGALRSVTVDPQGKFAYVTASCCVYVYAIDARTGALAPSAHIALGPPGEFALEGFAIDPTGRFAYAINDNRIYAYRIDPTTGKLRATFVRGVSAGAALYDVHIDLTNTFGYVLGSSSPTATKIYAYRINSESGELAPLAHSPFAVAANTTDPIARWFNAGRCATFSSWSWNSGHPPPVAKRGWAGLFEDPRNPSSAGYFYDPTHRLALHYPGGDSGGMITLRLSGAPPAGVPRRDLSKLQSASRVTIGTSDEALVRALGKPEIVAGCSQQMYVYLSSPVNGAEGEPLSLEFTITHGRVTEISFERGG